MKKSLSVLIVTILITMLLPFTVFAESGKCGDTAIYAIENGVLTISGTGRMFDYLEVYGEGNYNVEGEDITGRGKLGDKEYYKRSIPWAKIDEKSQPITKVIVGEGITYLGANAFHDLKEVTEIILPSSLEEIGSGCFYGCKSLKSIDIPASVKSLGNVDTYNDYAMFEYCSSLEQINIPESSQLKYIESAAFFECGTYDGFEIYIPETVENIGSGAFCGYIKNINVAENNQNYCSQDGVVYSKDITSLIAYPVLKKSKEFTIPNTVVNIESRAFYYFGLAYIDLNTKEIIDTTKLYIPNTVKEMGEYAIQPAKNAELYFATGAEEFQKYIDDKSIFGVTEYHLNYNDIVSNNNDTVSNNTENSNMFKFVISLAGGIIIVILSVILFKRKVKR